MLNGIKKKIKGTFCSLTPGFVKRGIISNYSVNARLSYAQEGEDLLLSRIIGDIGRGGFFVDIGAHHPQLFSNTYKLYEAGWRGINIDAMPGSMKPFEDLRSGDINLEIPISDGEEELEYYIFNHPELNTFSKSQAEHWSGIDSIRIVRTVKLTTRTLASILEKHAPGRKDFDLLSVDVEGLDHKIISTIDFGTYKFRHIIVEDNPADVLSVMEGDIYRTLTANGYKLVSKLYYSCIYMPIS